MVNGVFYFCSLLPSYISSVAGRMQLPTQDPGYMPSSGDAPGDGRVGELLNREEAHSPKGKGKDWKPHQDSEVTQGFRRGLQDIV